MVCHFSHSLHLSRRTRSVGRFSRLCLCLISFQISFLGAWQKAKNLKFQLHTFVFDLVKSKFTAAGAPNEQGGIHSETVVSKRKSKSVLPAVAGRKKLSRNSVRQNLYPSSKRLQSDQSLPPIDDVAFSPPGEKRVNECEGDAPSFLNSSAIPSNTNSKSIEMQKSHSTRGILPSAVTQSPMLASSSENHLPHSQTPLTTEKSSTEPHKSKNGPNDKIFPPVKESRRSSMSRLSITKIDIPTSQIDQWIVLSSTINSALHVVVET
jgi:hypothetical protein